MNCEGIRVAIIDDEEPARNELKYLLGRFADINLVLEAENSLELLNNLARCQPQLIFMDIEMPQDNGLKLAQQLHDMRVSPLIIFATAHEEFALKAFELNATDYILKPFSLKRVTKCVEKVRVLLKPDRVSDSVNLTPTQELATKNKIAVEYNGKASIINTDDIIVACCEEGQLLIYTTNKVYYSNMSMNELQMRLNSHFFRCHRAYLVNTEKITEVIPWFHGTLNLVLEGVNAFEVPVSRHQAPKLKKIFGL